MIVRLREKAYSLLKQEHDKSYVPIAVIASNIIEKHYDPKQSAKPKQTHQMFQPLKQIYCEYFEKHNGVQYRWNGAIDAKALNRLIKSLESYTDKPIDDLFKYIMEKLPKFWHNKSINAIDKNISSIISEIKNEQRTIDPKQQWAELERMWDSDKQ